MYALAGSEIISGSVVEAEPSKLWCKCAIPGIATRVGFLRKTSKGRYQLRYATVYNGPLTSFPGSTAPVPTPTYTCTYIQLISTIELCYMRTIVTLQVHNLT